MTTPETITTTPSTVPPYVVTDGDRITLLRALTSIKTARKRLKDPNRKAAQQALGLLSITLLYVAGFFDGKGIGKPGLHSEFQKIFRASPTATELDTQLDEFQKNLESIIEPTPTRSPAMLFVAGMGFVAYGIYLRYRAAQEEAGQ